MKSLVKVLVALFVLAAFPAYANFQHIIVIVQENRTPDNLFYSLCTQPGIQCSTSGAAGTYDIQTSNWLDNQSATGYIQPQAFSLGTYFDLDHSHQPAWESMCDALAGGTCRMDGAAGESCHADNPEVSCPPNPQFLYVDNSTHAIDSYIFLATQYGWANYMFQSNQGPSFPAHQFLFGATSAPDTRGGQELDAQGIFAAENPKSLQTGCVWPMTKVSIINSSGVEFEQVPSCFDRPTISDLLEQASLSWKYYASSSDFFWTAPSAIAHICDSPGAGQACTGTEWSHVDEPNPSDVLTDINNCTLPAVSWVTPTGPNSDHAGKNETGGPDWVASIVNAVGNAPQCPGAGSGYWQNTAIIVTWDDWGGWYDHEPPTLLPYPYRAYQWGFRVPMLFVSAYTPQGTINNIRMDFGAIANFIEGNFGIPEGSLGYDDARDPYDLHDFYNLNLSPRPFQQIPAHHDAQWFIHDKTPPTPPDND